MNIEISPKEYEKVLNWDDAMLYCQLLTINGKDDWHLPTKEELNDIYHSENDFILSYYWSSTEVNGNYAWYQFFSDGFQANGSDKNYLGYVRPVRTIEPS
jgi:hypothetical protein